MLGMLFGRALDVIAGSPVGYGNLSASETAKVVQTEKEVLVLDVRTQQEFNGELGHIRGAKLIPMDELPNRIGELSAFKSKKVIVVCRSGIRSRKAASILAGAGFENIYNVTSGMMGINQILGAPVER